MTRNDIIAMVRPTAIVFGCVFPPLVNFGQDSLWHILLVPLFVWSVGQWFKLYIQIQKRSA